MKSNKAKRIIAVIALVFMVIASITIIITLFDPNLLGGSVGYIALVSFLFGVGFFLVIKLMFKEPKEPDYLPKADEDESEQEERAAEQNESETPEDAQPQDVPQEDNKAN